MSSTPPSPAADAGTAGPTSPRRRLFAIFAVVLAVLAIGYGLYYVLVLSRHATTDNAYVGADVASITPQVNGQVQAVPVEDTETVHAGDVLVQIDPADARLAVAQAEADYHRAVRRVQQYLANDQTATATIAARAASIAHAKARLVAAQSDVARTAIDFRRREALIDMGGVSGEDLSSAKNAWQTALASLDAARAAVVEANSARDVAEGELAAAQALTRDARIDDNPEVQAAKAALDLARLNLSRTVLRAPFDGVVSQRNVQVGQRVAIGTQLMTVVPLDRLYVDANFKEVQLRKVQTGQSAELTADLYGSNVIFHGTVQGLAGGTGSATALIPAQNATGNWIKVVQRLPVRIRLDPKELRDHPLRVGLSMNVTVNVASHGVTTSAAH